MAEDFETQWEMAARTANWKCPSCGAIQRKTEQMKRLTIAKERNEQLIVNLDVAACPKCNAPIDLLSLADGKYDFKSTREKKEEAQGCSCVLGVIGGVLLLLLFISFTAGRFRYLPLSQHSQFYLRLLTTTSNLKSNVILSVSAVAPPDISALHQC